MENIRNFILIDPKRKTKEITVFAKKQFHIGVKNAYQKQILLRNLDLFYKTDNEEVRGASKRLAESLLEVRYLGFEEKLCKQYFHYDASDLPEPKTVGVPIKKHRKDLRLQQKHLGILMSIFL